MSPFRVVPRSAQWTPCDQCEGAVAGKHLRQCLRHLSPSERVRALRESKGEIDARGVFHGDAAFRRTQFAGRLDFGGGRFRASCTFRRADFLDESVFDRREYLGYVIFEQTTFVGAARFRDARFWSDVSFMMAQFRGPVDFRRTRFAGDSRYRNARFEKGPPRCDNLARFNEGWWPGKNVTALEKAFAGVDFAVFLFTPDDLRVKDGTTQAVPRDNIVFEAGMSVGALGIERTFIIAPRDLTVGIPTDLAGLSLVTYSHDDAMSDLEQAMGVAATRVRMAMERIGPRPIR